MINKNAYEDYTLILGNGFALDVYLPALIELNSSNIVLPIRAKKLINKDFFIENIKWINQNEIEHHIFSKIIIAEPPESQYKLICENSLWKNCCNIILEKPIADDHIKAKHLIHTLNKNKIDYSINYTFRYTKWYNIIYKHIINNIDKGNIDIIWKFKGRHLKKEKPSWKTNHLKGGGVIKYYGIHLIAILSDMGYSHVNQSNIFNQPKNMLKSWSCEFNSNKKLPKIYLQLDSYSNENIFSWQQNNQTILEIDSPFSLESSKYYGDNRIPTTIKFLKEEHNDLLKRKNNNVLELWSKIESMI